MTRIIGVFGRGRLGSLIAETIETDPAYTCAWMLGRDDQPRGRVDVAIDVSHADAVDRHVAWATESGTDLIIGATGWPAQGLRGSGRRNAVLIAPNFSLSMALMRRFAAVLGGYAARLPDQVDLAVTETHHRGKVDAPSGSAVLLADALADGAGVAAGDIPTTSLRLGAVVGTHEVRFETESEAIMLSHQAHTRAVFASGALAAAAWVNGKQGVFTLDDWAADQLDDLFVTSPRVPTHPRAGPDAPAIHTGQITTPTLQEQS